MEPRIQRQNLVASSRNTGGYLRKCWQIQISVKDLAFAPSEAISEKLTPLVERSSLNPVSFVELSRHWTATWSDAEELAESSEGAAGTVGGGVVSEPSRNAATVAAVLFMLRAFSAEFDGLLS